MLRVNKITDYGIVSLVQLASDPAAATHNARELAEATHIPLPVVSKTLKRLAREGILVSHRGAKGGYELARSPDEISLAEIITALEGPIGLMECSVTLGQCPQESTCRVRGPWQQINQAIRNALTQVTLSELVPAEPQGAPPGGGFETIRISAAAGAV